MRAVTMHISTIHNNIAISNQNNILVLIGANVAKMAGMPRWILERAKEMLKQLEASRQAAESGEDRLQLSMFQLDDPLLEDLRKQILGLNIDELKPVEALMLLNDLKRKLSK